MTIQSQPMTAQEQRAIVCICILAAYADGNQHEFERAQIQKIVNGFSGEQFDLSSAYQDVLGGKVTLADAVGQLQTPASKALAYEMAVCLCNADGVLQDAERQFLADLRQTLHLDPATVDAHQQTAQALAGQSFTPPPVVSNINNAGLEADLDRMILNAAILNGALEIVPHSLANMAIIPLQMRLVYQIGNRYGYQLDSGHIKEFLATVGVGLTSQVFEGFTRRLVGGFAGGLVGGLLGGLVKEATGSAVGFASTYALGQVARRYYASGRTLSTQQLKDVFSSMLNQGRSMQSGYSGDIAARARSVVSGR
jgi:uncharacterized protein (DUF697 family)/tellurite resistance protein